jgi:hypothetical protein
MRDIAAPTYGNAAAGAWSPMGSHASRLRLRLPERSAPLRHDPAARPSPGPTAIRSRPPRRLRAPTRGTSALPQGAVDPSGPDLAPVRLVVTGA